MATLTSVPFYLQQVLDEGSEQSLAGIIAELDSAIAKADGEQTEAFCAEHLGLVETHDLCVYPSEQRLVPDVGLVYGIPKALLPKDRTRRFFSWTPSGLAIPPFSCGLPF